MILSSRLAEASFDEVTSSSAVAERSCDAVCRPSVVSFNNVIPGAQSFIIVT